MNVTRTVIVRNLSIPISIGVHEHEKHGPQRLLVSVEAEIEPAGRADDRLDTTLDYDLICDFIRAQARQPHVELQETVARRVLDFTLGLPGVVKVMVETRKPDVFDDCDYVGSRLSAKVTK
ncbi:MAG: dihydroneopterin aldolase [Rhizobiaceae bacterium]|nr:dihydroneopterin aldolase [Rhizobiaceae bacterium]